MHFTQHDIMVARFVHRMQRAVDPCQRAVEDGRTMVRQAMRNAGKAILARPRKGAAQIFLIVGEDIDAKASRRFDPWPAGRAFVGEKSDQRRTERHRGEGAHDHAGATAIGLHRRHHAHAGGIMPQYLPEKFAFYGRSHNPPSYIASSARTTSRLM